MIILVRRAINSVASRCGRIRDGDEKLLVFGELFYTRFHWASSLLLYSFDAYSFIQWSDVNLLEILIRLFDDCSAFTLSMEANLRKSNHDRERTNLESSLLKLREKRKSLRWGENVVTYEGGFRYPRFAPFYIFRTRFNTWQEPKKVTLLV